MSDIYPHTRERALETALEFYRGHNTPAAELIKAAEVFARYLVGEINVSVSVRESGIVDFTLSVHDGDGLSVKGGDVGPVVGDARIVGGDQLVGQAVDQTLSGQNISAHSGSSSVAADGDSAREVTTSSRANTVPEDGASHQNEDDASEGGAHGA